jgi:hypothetical protein
MGKAVFAANEAQNRGGTRAQAQAVVNELPTPNARAAGNDVLWYVYVSNGDKRLSSRKLSTLIERACNIRMGDK